MTRIGLLSDTHSLLDERVLEHFATVDEIWHTGDVGAIDVLQALQDWVKQQPDHRRLRAVRGNIDSGDVQWMLREVECFRVEDVNVLLTHIGYQHGFLTASVRGILEREAAAGRPVRLFCSGHSHILRVQYDKYHQLLSLNPGAAGKYGIQAMQTLLRFTIDGAEIRDLEVIELSRR